ncbi:MAG: 2-succinyl-5-enolpyruvyl-6-hydroxy-3-cyclohexene-1-carboxylic-acid synthase [Muribaculaceae bacterium]|jgi:2-succinyl-5-enolpyruvyl-6-hydroxy-3-cyclohexene-1-carboxylate synthase
MKKMKQTEFVAKQTCTIVADLLHAWGVEDVVLSPGSRNAPLIMSIVRSGRFRTHVVIDERSAAFIALGMSLASERPVAAVCTSGTALLNYAPAVAEAYYRRVPLIAVSADRPLRWIDQDDSQTIRQAGCLDNIVRASVDIPSEDGTEEQLWYANRLVNDAMSAATGPLKGPVHINVRLDEPLTAMLPENVRPYKGHKIECRRDGFSGAMAPELAAALSSAPKILVVAGFMPPDQSVRDALLRMARMRRIVVLHEAQANLHGVVGDGSSFIANIDRVLSEIKDGEERRALIPDIVITLGGALTSRNIKAFLRTADPCPRHIAVGYNDKAIDCFKLLSDRIEMTPSAFVGALSGLLDSACDAATEFFDRWNYMAVRAAERYRAVADRAPWSDLKAMDILSRLVNDSGAGWQLHYSNGTAVRYGQLVDYGRYGRIDCNRGVSGIDGSTSTAIGAACAVPDRVTLLVTGDMSAQYDMGALAAAFIPPRFKMVVLNNGGGGIFRFIKSTSALPELDEFFAADVRLPLRQLASAFGFAFYEAGNEAELRMAWPLFAAQDERPAILNLITPPSESADILKNYFNTK